jgi:hypothetical protein
MPNNRERIAELLAAWSGFLGQYRNGNVPLTPGELADFIIARVTV